MSFLNSQLVTFQINKLFIDSVVADFATTDKHTSQEDIGATVRIFRTVQQRHIIEVQA